MNSTVRSEYAQLEEVRLFYRISGSGSELVILVHGWPQTSLCWRKVISALGSRYTVVAPDLRGYGLSGLAQTGYDKRATADDLGQLVRHLGHVSALVAGHDRGARVAHRWALDRPEEVRKLALLDVLPTREVMNNYDRTSATALWHWFFHLQPDLPELLLRGNVEPYLRFFFQEALSTGAIDDATFFQYVEAFSDPAHMHASLEDYRAGFGIDLNLDEKNYAQGIVLTQPLLLLWGADGGLGSADVVNVWQRYARDVRGAAICRCKHYLPEEQPQDVITELRRFFADQGTH